MSTPTLSKASDRAPFYAHVREELRVLNQHQVNGFECLFEEWFKFAFTDLRWLAYLLATAWHETAFTMQPITEQGGLKYLRSKAYFPFYGRGFVQLTWSTNYKRYGIQATPEKALDPAVAAHIILDGMTKGIFTGKSLSNYFGAKISDPVNARRIINGTDKAQKIAGYYAIFLGALNHIDAPTQEVA